MKLILAPTTIRLLAWHPPRYSWTSARDPLARRRFARRTLLIAAALAVVIATLISFP
jgi:hypothetical protein